jgi:hypothetical protein
VAHRGLAQLVDRVAYRQHRRGAGRQEHTARKNENPPAVKAERVVVRYAERHHGWRFAGAQMLGVEPMTLRVD